MPKLFKDYSDKVSQKYQKTEPSIRLTLEECEGGCEAFSRNDTKILLESLASCPNGPLEHDGHGIKTSSSIGLISSGDKTVMVTIKPRSSDDQVLEELISRITDAFTGEIGRAHV